VSVAEWQDIDMNFRTKVCQICGKEYQHCNSSKGNKTPEEWVGMAVLHA
jgi:RNA polymerase subunit RPABC4/transcription elongation factor Spt4